MKYFALGILIIYLILILILIFNMHKRNTFIKFSFFALFAGILLYILVTNELVVNNILRFLIELIFYPTFTECMFILAFTIAYFMYNIINDHIYDRVRIINYIFSCFIFISILIFWLLKIDITSYNAMYTGNSLILLRYISRTFLLWIFVIINTRYYQFFLDKRW